MNASLRPIVCAHAAAVNMGSQLTVDDVLSKIRFDDESKRGSVLDVIQLVTDCIQNVASQTFTRLGAQFPEVKTKCFDFKFPGRGQRPTPVAAVPTLIEIAWLCPGRNAKEFRRTGAVTLCRALGGDLSLVDEIKARHAQVAGTNEQAALLHGTGVSVAEANGLAIASANELDVAERRVRIRLMEQEARRMELEVRGMERDAVRDAMLLSNDLLERADKHDDERMRLFLKDNANNIIQMYVNAALGMAPALLTDGGIPNPNAPITLGTVAGDLGYQSLTRAELQAIGREAARLYREEHGGEGPPKHAQFVDGAVRQVSSYFEKDRPIITRAVQNVMA